MIQINYQDKRPIYEQVTERIQQLIVKGVLGPNEKLPSVRNLAVDLSINPNTIQKSYQRLEQLGFIYTVKGRGNFVSEDSSWKLEREDECMKSLEADLKVAKALGIGENTIVQMVHKFMEGSEDA